MGYFGIGAAAGVLAAGVGAALAGDTVAGGGFTAGFIGTANVTATGFTAGAISGATAGVTNGLIVGTGNDMMSGNKFKEAFMKGGLDQAWKQGLSGAAFGGIIGGIDAVTNDRNFWTGSSKQNVVGNSERIISNSDYSRKSTSKAVKNYNDVHVSERRDAFSMEVEVPGMNKITNVTLDFSIGAQAECHISIRGWRWQHNTRNSNFPLKLVYSHSSNYSSLFFYLKYIK